MKKDTIVQFVCFVTNLDLEEFAPNWERYAKRFINKNADAVLQEQVIQSKNKYRYVSKHEWPQRDFQFSFMNEKKSEHFPERNVRVIQVGGYIPLEAQKKSQKDGDTRVIAFVSHNETDLDFYRHLPYYRNLYIHQAYYESCTYGYVLEFVVDEINAKDLLLELKHRPGVETGVYRDCLVPHE